MNSSLYSWLRNAFSARNVQLFCELLSRRKPIFVAIAFSASAASCVFYWPFGDANSKLSLYPLESKQFQVTISATSFQGFWLVRSLNKGLWLVRALFIFSADLGCIVKWTFISGGWETNLVSWSLSSICNIFCYNRPWIVLYYPEPEHWPHPRGL